MAETTVSTAERVTQWDDAFFAEYVRTNRFKRYMGTGENSIIQVKENLTKKPGDAITVNLIGALDASAGPNTGSTNLVGNEKALPNDGHKITIGVIRDATVVNNLEAQVSPIDIRNAAKTALKDLSTRYLRNDIISALHTIDGIKYGSASEAQKDAWLVNNADRVLFGSAKSNNAANDHSAALANVDATNDKLTGSVVELAKRMAQTASTANGDGIRPFTFGEDEETFVMFVPSVAFRDLRAWIVTNGYWENAMERGKDNPLFTGTTSVYWDGVIVREIPEINTIPSVGASSIAVAPCFLCGAQAMGIAWAQRTKTTLRSEDDYGYRKGVGFEEMRGIEKLQWGKGSGNAIDWSVATVYVSGVADA